MRTSARPADAHVAVPYEAEWSWIAGDDWKSKRTFTLATALLPWASRAEENNKWTFDLSLYDLAAGT